MRKVRTKLNQRQLEKKIDSDLNRRYVYIIPRDGTVPFVPPVENSMNRFFGHDAPLVKVDAEGRFSVDGEMGKLKIFYVPEKQYQQVHQILKDAKIPEHLHQDLVWAFLNMAFAGCMATYSTNFNTEFERLQSELFQTIDLLEAFASEKKLLRGMRLEWRDRLEGKDQAGRPNFGPMKSKTIKGHHAVQMVEKVLKEYKALKDYHIFQTMYDMRKEKGKTDMFFGHKNAEKHSQSHYAWAVFNYFRQHLFSSAFEYLEDPEKYEEEVAQLKALYPRKQLYLCIGRLMILARLLSVQPDQDDEDIIEIIEKKLAPYSQASKKRVKSISENNRMRTDGMKEVIFFPDLF